VHTYYYLSDDYSSGIDQRSIKSLVGDSNEQHAARSTRLTVTATAARR